MFKRNDESEWSRFSKAFTGKEDKEAPKGESELADVSGKDDGGSAEPANGASFHTVRPSQLDTNLSVARPPAVAPVHPVFSAEDVESTIGEHTSFDGTMHSENSVRIRGTAQGEVESAKAVFIDEGAQVTAKVTAVSITVAGEVNGELNCSGRVEIRPSGRVTGTISAATLVMQEGAFFDGNLRMRSGSEAISSKK